MKTKLLQVLAIVLVLSNSVYAQQKENTDLLKIIFTTYYKNEKIIAKNRLQLLRFYCKKAPNNEEVLEVISKNELVKRNEVEVKSQIKTSAEEDWSEEYNALFLNQNQYLKRKVNDCISLEDFKQIAEKHQENNIRLLILSKPIYFSHGNYALVKVAFYRTIEHNNGSYILFEKRDGQWIIIDHINEWAT
jgi:hypothetical protein